MLMIFLGSKTFPIPYFWQTLVWDEYWSSRIWSLGLVSDLLIMAWGTKQWKQRLDEAILEYQPAFLGPSSLLGIIPWDWPKKIPEETEICSLESQGNVLALHPPHCPKGPQLHHSMVQAALELHTSHQPFHFDGNRSSLAPVLLGSSLPWRRKLWRHILGVGWIQVPLVWAMQKIWYTLE